MLKLRHIAGRLIVLMALALMALTATQAQQKGKASYYSQKANGARTSSGARLNNDSLVCAHRTYPFGTLLLVRNPANGKEVIVKVIDRGPHGRGRIIDLSYEAAKRLGIIAAGVAVVEVSEYDDTMIPYLPKPHKYPELELELPVHGEEADVLRPVWQHGRQDSTTIKKHNKR